MPMRVIVTCVGERAGLGGHDTVVIDCMAGARATQRYGELNPAKPADRKSAREVEVRRDCRTEPRWRPIPDEVERLLLACRGCHRDPGIDPSVDRGVQIQGLKMIAPLDVEVVAA